MDRLPWDAALYGCIVVTNGEGAAGQPHRQSLQPENQVEDWNKSTTISCKRKCRGETLPSIILRTVHCDILIPMSRTGKQLPPPSLHMYHLRQRRERRRIKLPSPRDSSVELVRLRESTGNTNASTKRGTITPPTALLTLHHGRLKGQNWGFASHHYQKLADDTKKGERMKNQETKWETGDQR